MKEKLRQMSDKLATAHVELEKFAGGNKSAGVRLRNVMQEVKVLATDVRNDVLAAQKGGAA
jgi:hypothetical protein